MMSKALLPWQAKSWAVPKVPRGAVGNTYAAAMGRKTAESYL